MRAAKLMSEEQTADLFEEFKKDQVRWAKFKELEFPEKPLTLEDTMPGRWEILYDFVAEKLGPDHGYVFGGLMILIQKSMHGFE
jgi:hypothetical protein